MNDALKHAARLRRVVDGEYGPLHDKSVEGVLMECVDFLEAIPSKTQLDARHHAVELAIQANCGRQPTTKNLIEAAREIEAYITGQGAVQDPAATLYQVHPDGSVSSVGPREMQLDSRQVKHMVNRFLSWRLPENFSPFDYVQAQAMVRHMLQDLPPSVSYDEESGE